MSTWLGRPDFSLLRLCLSRCLRLLGCLLSLFSAVLSSIDPALCRCNGSMSTAIPVLSESAISPWSSGWPGCLFLPGGGRGRSGTTVPATCLRRGCRLRRSGSVLPIPVVLPRAVGPLVLALPASIPPTGGSIPRIWVTLSWGGRVVGVYHVPWHAGLPAEIGDVDLGLGWGSTRTEPWSGGSTLAAPLPCKKQSYTVGAYWAQKQLVTTQRSWLGHLTFPRVARMCQKGLRSRQVSYMTCHLYS